MRPRYLVLVERGPDLANAAGRIAGATGLRVAHCRPPVAILVNEACTCLEVDADAWIVGTLFHRHGPPRQISGLGDAERATLVREGTRKLLDTYWGGYLSVRVRGDTVELLRDPSAALPCYRAGHDGAVLFASDVELLSVAGGETRTVDWDALGQFFYFPGWPAVETALAGVTELRAGEAIALGERSESPAAGWSPWDFVEPRAGEDSIATTERLRRVIEQCISAWSSLYRRPLVSVSGGLDSSIIAACLASSGTKASCITLYTDDAAGDERGFARQLCDSIGLPLTECRYDLDGVELDRALGAHLPRPVGRAEAQPYEAAHRAVAARDGADVFFSGNGGDNVFGYSLSAAALADRALREGPGAGAFATLRDICRQTGAGPLRVTRAAARIARQPAGYRCRPGPAFLHPDFVASLRHSTFSHPWLDAPRWALPGKAAHIAGLLRAHLTLESDRSLVAPLINPLLSQPVIEMCLSIPSWQWREGGRDRAAVRTAFAGRLPHEIAERKVKGTPDGFCGEIIQRDRATLRERLLGGQLAAKGLLDRAMIEEALGAHRHTTSQENVRLVELANAEAWLDARSMRQGGS